MIAASKIPAALHASQHILWTARFYVGEGMDQQSLYTLMDEAEYLPWLLVNGAADSTEDFRRSLAGIGERFPMLSGVLARFDAGQTWPDAVVPSEP
jgi:hypothetical protein